MYNTCIIIRNSQKLLYKPANCVCKSLKTQVKLSISFASIAIALIVLKFCSK